MTKASKNYSVDLSRELDRAYDHFNQEFADGILPKAIITVSRDTAKKAYGWFCANGWSDSSNTDQINEITLCQSAFSRGTHEVFDTLLHEMAHMYNFVIHGKIVDCTSQQRHNKIFKAAAEKFGLTVTSSTRFGSAHTELGPIADAAIAVLAPDMSVYALAAGVGSIMATEDEEKKKQNKKKAKTAAVIISKDTKKKITDNAARLGTTSKSLTEKAVEYYLDMLAKGKVPNKYLVEKKEDKTTKKS
jgi:hypothetical protein